MNFLSGDRSTAAALTRDLVFLILKFLDEENFAETVHQLEKECGYFFNMRYFEEIVTNGEWDEVEKYLSGFTKVDDNRHSTKIFFEIRKQKFLETLDKGDRAKALEILRKELKGLYSTSDEELFKETTMLLTLKNFRKNKNLSNYQDATHARTLMLDELKILIKANPLFRNKLQFPKFSNSRLRLLIKQSMNWKHYFCKNPNIFPQLRSRLHEHSFETPDTALAPSHPMNSQMSFNPNPPQPTLPYWMASLAESMANQSSLRHRTIFEGTSGTAAHSPAGYLLLRRSRCSGASDKNGDQENLANVEPQSTSISDNSGARKLTEYRERSQLRSLWLPDDLLPIRILRMIYTNSGSAILALLYNSVHKLWKWQSNELNPSGKATCNEQPQLWQPSSGILMTNDTSDTNLEDAVPCFALSKNDSYLISTSGGKISLFNVLTFKTITKFMGLPPGATYLAFYPQNNNIIAIGMEDSSIQIYEAPKDEVKRELKGHQKRVTGLAFSNTLNVLVSSGADAQLCVWSTDQWEKRASKFLQIPTAYMPTSLVQTRVQFHPDQVHFLAVQETQLAIYEAPKLDCLKQWVHPEARAPITDAVYSSDGLSIYASFKDGSVCIFTASMLQLRCGICPSAYIPPNTSTSVYPAAIAAHPSEPNQFALGLTDGGVHVLEPLESEGKWGTDPPVNDAPGPSTSAPGS